MFRQFVRRFATLQKTGKPESTVLKDPVRQVFISQSNDVFTNLALEDWLYRHHDFAHKVRNPPKFVKLKEDLRFHELFCVLLKLVSYIEKHLFGNGFFLLFSICYCYGEMIHVLSLADIKTLGPSRMFHFYGKIRLIWPDAIVEVSHFSSFFFLHKTF